MSLFLLPLNYNWSPVTRGDTFPGINFTDDAADTDLSSISVTIKSSNGEDVLVLSSSGNGITINTPTAGAWDFTIDTISASDTLALTAGLYHYELKTTDSAGTVRTEFSGSWEIQKQIID